MMVEKMLSRSVRLMFVGGVAMSASLLAQQAVAQEASVQRVEITGSSVKRVDGETALSVQVINKTEIARTGATSTQELLNSISSLSSSGATNNATGAGSSTYGVSSISLRGLGSERTLVLVNGRRLAAFAAGGGATVNVNVIPLAAIERVEVLKDGASGVYGSDAVAGVVNFILSKNFQGVEATAGYGSPSTKGGGQNKKASITAGFGNLDTDRFSVVLSASMEKEDALFAKDREYAKSGNNSPYYTAGATGQGNIEGAVVPGAYPTSPDRVPGFGNSPGSGYGNPLAASNTCESIKMFKNATNTSKGAPYCAFDSNGFVGLIPDRELTNFTGNFAFKINANHELFADALYSKSTVTQTFQASPVRRSFLTTDAEFANQKVDPFLTLYPSNPAYQNIAVPYLTAQGFNSLIGKPLAITSRVFDFGGRQSKDVATQSRMVIGAKGSVLGQDYEVAFAANQSKVDGTVPGGYFSQVAYAKIINDPANNWNPWVAGGAQTGALAEKLKTAQYTGDTIHGTSKSRVADAKLSGDLPELAGITAQYAAGLQTRRESYLTNPSPAMTAGDVAGLGGAVPPIDQSRTINSVFGELSVPFLKNLEGGLAVRNDRYNDVGASTNYKANVRWQPTKPLVLRASVGTGFRAPTLTDLWTPQTTGSTAQFNDPATGQSQLQVTGVSGGNPNLKPEKSKQKSVGMVLSPFNNFTFGVDLFEVQVKDILATPSAQEVVSRFRAGDPAYKNLVTLNGNDVDTVQTTLANTGDAIVAGADVFAVWRLNSSVGKFDFALNGTYMSKYDQTSPGGTISQKVGTLVDANGDPVLGADSGGIVLRWKHALSGTWTYGDFATTLIQNYYNGYETGFRQVDGERNFVSAQSLYDANVTYKGIKGLTLGLGVRNLTNKQPPIFVPVSNQFQSGYDITQYDPRGRFVYVTVGYRFM
ncbi:TonB-dependent receptor [Undibacterium parvum]|uniref:TonB-dependent receptor n=2 Tax=Undibacterium parvum TaxID=401471 RepID=A0A3S9HQZ5_9BURK|nr:TonB-dependent receptor [Undibacterium parvum]